MPKKPDFTSAIGKRVDDIKAAKAGQKEATELMINDIKEPIFHDRTDFSSEEIISLANNIKEKGLLQPIVVRRLPNGDLERMVGFRRIEAHKFLGKDRIKAIVLENVSDMEAIEIMLSENLQRSDLNAYDEVLSHVKLLSVHFFGVPDRIDDTVKKLYGIQNFLTGALKSTEEREHETIKVIESFKTLGRFPSIRGFINKLKLLKLRADLIDLIKSRKISYTIAMKLDQISKGVSEENFQKIVKEVIRRGCSNREIDEVAKRYRENKNEINAFSVPTFLNDFKKRFKNVPKERKQLIEEKLKEISALLCEGNKDESSDA